MPFPLMGLSRNSYAETHGGKSEDREVTLLKRRSLSSSKLTGIDSGVEHGAKVKSHGSQPFRKAVWRPSRSLKYMLTADITILF